MTAQHTPIPWEMYRTSGEDGHRWGVSSPSKGCISCAVAREEDARLIAAAPLMLEALMEAQLTIDWFRRMALDDQNPREFDPVAWTQAKQSNRQAVAAIRAATGEDA